MALAMATLEVPASWTPVSSTRPLDLSTELPNYSALFINSDIIESGTRPDHTLRPLLDLTVIYVADVQGQCQATLHNRHLLPFVSGSGIPRHHQEYAVSPTYPRPGLHPLHL